MNTMYSLHVCLVLVWFCHPFCFKTEKPLEAKGRQPQTRLVHMLHWVLTGQVFKKKFNCYVKDDLLLAKQKHKTDITRKTKLYHNFKEIINLIALAIVSIKPST